MKVLYLAWLGSNNLGDVLMWDVFKSLSEHYLDTKKIQVIPSLPDVDIRDVRPYDLVVLGGGSIIHPKYIDILYKAVQLGKKVMIWGSGIDSLDKNRVDQFLGKKSSTKLEPIFEPKHEQKLIEIIERAEYVGVRGPLTFKALKEMGANIQKVEQSLDSGLLIKPKNSVLVPLNEWSENKKIVGLNWGTSYNKIFGGSELKIEKHLVQVTRNLIKKGYKIYMYHVWWRDRGPSQRLYKKINDPQNVKFDNQLYNTYEMMSIMQQCDFTINFKLHANVLSAVAHVPFIALGYRMKVLDFAASVGLQDFVLSTDHSDLGTQMLNMIPTLNKKKNFMIQKVNQFSLLSKKQLTKPFINNLYL